MKFAKLRHRVARAESLVEGRRQQTLQHGEDLLKHWKRAWTPWRIVAAGLGVGFLTGHTRPTRALGATKWLRVIGTMSGVFSSLQSAMAAWQAEQAEQSAQSDPDDARAEAPAQPEAQTAPQTGADDTDVQEAQDRAHHASVSHAAGMATADDGSHSQASSVSSYARSSAGRGGTEHWAAKPPGPAEAATDVSER